MEKISDIFGSMVFNDAVMRERLPKETYRQVQATMEKGKRLDDDAAPVSYTHLTLPTTSRV